MPPEPPLAFARHDHADCIGTALAQVERTCAAEGLRLTPLRRRVLEILLETHAAMGAYDVLARLAAEGHAAQPPVAYRALEFLVAHGFAHKVRRLNAFVACARPGETHSPAFLICRACDSVAEAEAEAPRAALAAAAAAAGFTVERAMIEALGLCAACREAA
jgi:Fur family zinc uptake transcriptional regulator